VITDVPVQLQLCMPSSRQIAVLLKADRSHLQNLEILAITRRELQAAKLLPTFRIALDPALIGSPAEQPARAAIKALSAELAQTPGK
jgi:hypothetical protein